MTTHTWFGGTGHFTTAGNWSPQGVPGTGDTAIINAGTSEITNADIRGVDLSLGGNLAQHTVLDVSDALIGDLVGTHGNLPTPTGPGYQTIDVSRIAVFTGDVTLTGALLDDMTINVAAGSLLLNTGTISGSSTQSLGLDITGGHGALVNQGLIRLDPGFDANMTIDPAVIGAGSIDVGGLSATAEFGGFVGPEQTVRLGVTANPTPVGSFTPDLLLKIDVAREFLATIAKFLPGETIELANTTATSQDFSNGVLTVANGHVPVAHLRFAGSYARNDFTLTENGSNAFIGLKGAVHA